MKLIVLRAGDVAPAVAERRGQYFEWIRREVGDAWSGEWLEHDVRTGAPLPTAKDATGFIITGSSSSVTERAPWMLATEALIRKIVDEAVPLFGICFGHQMVAEALGGKVGKNPNGREIGTIDVRVRPMVRPEPILTGLGPVFRANHTHVDTVVSLPPGARVLGETSLEANAIFVVGETTKCVQFHPEIDGDAMRGYVEARAHLIEAEGGDANAVRDAVSDTPEGAATLRNFVRHVVNRSI